MLSRSTRNSTATTPIVIASRTITIADMVPGSPVQSTSVPLDQFYRGFITIDTASLDDFSYGAVEDAFLKFNSGDVFAPGTVEIVPMYIDVHDGELWDDISNPAYYDTENLVSVDVTTANDVTVSIESILNRCRAYGVSTFALIIPSGNLCSILNPSNIQLDSLTIWRTQ